jgi:ABC-2 type transport system ATP-binding protein
LWLRAADVTKSYGGREVLSGVTFELGVGVAVLLGPNGAGKSTLCRILAGAEAPSSGQVASPSGGFNAGKLRRDHLRVSGWLPQSITLPRTTTVLDYLNYAAWLKGLSKRQRVQAVDRVLDQTELGDRRRSLVRHLSGGMQRRLGLAQALVNDPAYLILDEPTAGLDPQQRDNLYALISATCHERVVLISTHLLEDVSVLGQRVIVLNNRLVRFDGTVADFARTGDGPDEMSRTRSAFLRLLVASTS